MALYDKQLDWYDLLMPGSQIPPMIGGSGGASGTDILDALGIGTQRRQQEFNSAEAQKQRDFEERMSNTSYQRAVEDIKAAGLNPSMLYASGGGSSMYVPSGASASSGVQGNANIIGQVGMLINSVNSARSLDIKMNNNEMSNRDSRNIYAMAGKIISKLI